MNREFEKSTKEMTVFHRFLKRSLLPIDPKSVEKRPPPEPDIKCLHVEDGILAFELVELCDPNIAKAFNRRDPDDVEVLWTSDPSSAVVLQKLSKSYETRYPAELLCYTDGRIITTDNVIIPTLKHDIDFASYGYFRRIWFMGESEIEVLHTAKS